MHHRHIKPYFVIVCKRDPSVVFYVGGVNYIDQYLVIYYDRELKHNAGRMTFSTLREYETSRLAWMRRRLYED